MEAALAEASETIENEQLGAALPGTPSPAPHAATKTRRAYSELSSAIHKQPMHRPSEAVNVLENGCTDFDHFHH